MKISCIIPTFNRNKYLLEAIDSVLAQTVLPDEIIIINNGKEKLELPEKIISKVKVYNIVCGAGASQARNFGASVASGDYLAFLDDDDLWNSEYLAKAKKEIDKDKKFILSRLDRMRDGEIKNFKNAKKTMTISNLLSYNPGITGSNIIIFKKVFLELGGFDVELPTSEDKALAIEALKKNIDIVVLSDNQAINRAHNDKRLVNSKKMAEGIGGFIKKYKNLMTKRIYFYNISKKFLYSYRSKISFNYIKYLFFRAMYLFFKILCKKTK